MPREAEKLELFCYSKTYLRAELYHITGKIASPQRNRWPAKSGLNETFFESSKLLEVGIEDKACSYGLRSIHDYRADSFAGAGAAPAVEHSALIRHRDKRNR